LLTIAGSVLILCARGAFSRHNGKETTMTILDPISGELITIDVAPRPRR
jgi:hypothetical protein